jgi:hypothetical protein
VQYRVAVAVSEQAFVMLDFQTANNQFAAFGKAVYVKA